MASRRRRLKRVSVTQGRPPIAIHERMATDLPINAKVAPMTVPDPYSTDGGTVIVLRSLRDDPLAALHSRGQVDTAQFLAGRHWQRSYELSEIGQVGAIDPTREAVDGGRPREILSDAYMRATKEIDLARKTLGQEGESIVHDVLIRGMPLLHVAAARGATAEREILYIGRRFRECLETLAVLYGYAMKGGR